MRRVFRLPFGRAGIAREVDDELAFHLEMRTQRLIAAGMTPDAAKLEALRQFGDVDTVRQDCVTMDNERERKMSRANTLGELQQDFVYALRTLRRNAGFTAIIVGALALGIGANTAIFSLIDAVVVRGLPVKDAGRLVAIGDPQRTSSFSQGSPRTDLISAPLYRDIRDHSRSFSGVLASGRPARLDVRIDEKNADAEHPRARYVSGNYFAVLGVPAFAGRVFDGSEDRSAGASPVAVISYAYWTRRFHNDRSAIGRTVVVNDTRITIVGVTPQSFTGEIVGASNDVWLPLSMHDVLHPHQRVLDDRSSSWLLLLGRLTPDATLAQAQQELTPFITRTIVANAPGSAGQSFLADKPKMYVSDGARGFSRVRATFQAPLFTLMIGVVLLLCIICANVANLLLARAIARGKEMAVRLALGADRGRLVRQLLTESVVLAMAGAATGLLLAWWGSHALLVLASGGSAIPLDLSLDLRVMAFTLVVSFFAVVLFGLAPAVRASRVELASTMRAGAQSVAGSALGNRGQRAPLGKLLIAGQVALSVVLLVGAAMLVRSLRNVQSVDVGLDRDHLLILGVDVNARGYSGARLSNLAHTLRDRIAVIPGVAAVAFSENGIFSGTESATTIEVPGFVARTPNDTSIAFDQVSPDYVRGIGARLIQGRDLATSDEGHPSRVAVVNQSLAQFYFPGENAVGKYLHVQDSVAIQIVGVIADTRDHQGTLQSEPSRRAYFSYVHADTVIGSPGSLRVEIRANGDPSALVQQVRATVKSIDPTLPIDGVDPLTKLMQQSIQEERLVAKLASAFGVLALVLASIGLYGVMTYAITRRTGEIGLRVALGAQQLDVVRMVLFDALRLVGIGMAVGLPLALASTRLLRTQLHGVGAVDPASIGAAMVVLMASAVVAVLLPAMRASKVSPIVALRAE
ncbi:MAG: permease [Gemmatimonadetes bacterium]|nr:permease [Gemmatimonadota bacterium]